MPTTSTEILVHLHTQKSAASRPSTYKRYSEKGNLRLINNQAVNNRAWYKCSNLMEHS